MKNLSKVLLTAIIAVIGLGSCKKKDEGFKGTILYPIEVSGNLATVKWSKSTGAKRHMLVRISDTTGSISNPPTRYIELDENINQFIDTLPVMPYVQYYVVTEGLPAAIAKSNKQTYVRTDFKGFNFKTLDILFDKEAHNLFLYGDTNRIIQYNLRSDEVAKRVTVEGSVGFCDLGFYNGIKELYVPSSSGSIYIYNANTLDLIDQINVGGDLFSVVCNNGYLFSTDSYNKLRVHSRTTKAMISQIEINHIHVRLKSIPNSNIELIGTNGSSGLSYYKFNAFGNLISSSYSYLNVDLPHQAFDISPDGNYFLTYKAGSVFTKEFINIGNLQDNSSHFCSFDFDTTNHLIYAATGSNEIQVFSANNFQFIKSINTIGYPMKVFYDNGRVISISSRLQDVFWYYSILTFIEQH